MKNLILAILLLASTIVLAQESSFPKNVVSTQIFKKESISHSIYGKLDLKFNNSLEYERIFKRWSWATAIEYGFNRINEDCDHCADHIHGIGYLRELNFFTGYNFRLTKKQHSIVQLFTGTDLYYANINYSGDFEGGFSGVGIKIDDSYNSFGLRQRLGIHIYASPQIRCTLTTAFRFGQSRLKESYEGGEYRYKETAATLPELKIGFLF